MKTTCAALLTAVFCLAAKPAFAQTLTIPNTFVAGTPAKAADVNANFTAVATAVNGLTKASAIDQTGCPSGICTTMTYNVTQTVNQISITTTGAGVAFVFFTGNVECGAAATAGVGISVWAQLVSTNVAPTLGDGLALFRGIAAVSDYYDSPMDAHRVFVVPAAGTYTYYYNAINRSSTVTCTYYGGNMSAMFIPS
jgi:hypothetical protein